MNKKLVIISFAIVLILVCAVFLIAYEHGHKRSILNYDSQTASTSASAVNDNSGQAGFLNYVSQQFNFSISYPQTLEATTTFASTYMVGSGWNLYSDPTKSTGVSVIDFRKIGSNDVSDAELRIGIATSSQDVADCTTTQPSEKASTVTINGQKFTVFTDSGAAMSHFSTATSFRIVHNNTCYAIDEFVTGTNPEVYDPPRTAPFTQDEAFQEMNQALATFIFTR